MEQQYIAIDVGGTSAKCALVSESGRITGKRTFLTGETLGREAFLLRLRAAIQALMAENVGGIGLCCPGFVDPRTGIISGGIENLPYLDGGISAPCRAGMVSVPARDGAQ